jgi:CubicO group peptidase (beta-lactamase class C family)
MDHSVASRLRAMVSSSVLGQCATSITCRDRSGAAFVLNCGEIGPGETMSEHTLMYAASLTKQLIGVLLALNVLEGTMSIDDPVRSYLTELPPWADNILLGHLAHHTSGLPSDAALRERGTARCDGWDNRRVLRHLADEIEPAVAPGTALEYSNLGYICLAEAIERAQGLPISDVARGRIFDPLRMASSSLSSDPLRHRAGTPDPPRSQGDGGLWTTAQDLAQFNDAMNAQLLGPGVKDLVETPGSLRDGTPVSYCWGLAAGTTNGGRALHHGGHFPGWTGKTVRMPERHVSVAVLCTSDEAVAVHQVALGLAALLDA